MALLVFLIVAIVASNLSSAGRARAREAIARRDEVTRLFDLSRDVLLTTESASALPSLARYAARRFELDTLALFLPREKGWERHEGGIRASSLEESELDRFLAKAGGAIEFDAHRRTYGGHQTRDGLDGVTEQVVPLRIGTRPIGLLSAAGPSVDPGTLDALAGVAAIAVERAHFLEERKAAELERQRAELASAVLASFSHDLRTPLAVIRSNVEVVADDGGATIGDWQEVGGIVRRNVEKMSEMIDGLLATARLQTGKAQAVAVDLADIVAAKAAEFGKPLGEQGIVLETSTTTALVEGVPVSLDRALTNLLDNAIGVSGPGSSIHIGAGKFDDWAWMAVADEGPGLPEEPDGGRIGLGLSIVEQIAAGHEGALVSSSRPGGGTTMVIWLPTDGVGSPHPNFVPFTNL